MITLFKDIVLFTKQTGAVGLLQVRFQPPPDTFDVSSSLTVSQAY